MKRFVVHALWLLSLAVIVAIPSPAHAETLSRAAVREYIETNMPWLPGSVRVDFLSKEPESIPQNREAVLRVEPAGNQDYIGDMVFLVKSFRDGNLLRTDSIRTRIEVQRDVVTAARGLSAGSVLAESDVRTVSRWVRRIHPHALSSLEEASGKRLTVRVAAGAELFATMLKEIPLVRKGKMVKMVFDNGAMQIVTVGLSEEDGVAGNIVRVKNITSNKIIYARVLSDSLVGIGF